MLSAPNSRHISKTNVCCFYLHVYLFSIYTHCVPPEKGNITHTVVSWPCLYQVIDNDTGKNQ